MFSYNFVAKLQQMADFFAHRCPRENICPICENITPLLGVAVAVTLPTEIRRKQKYFEQYEKCNLSCDRSRGLFGLKHLRPTTGAWREGKSVCARGRQGGKVYPTGGGDFLWQHMRQGLA